MAALFLHMRGIELFFERVVFFDVVPSRSPSLIIVNGGSHPERALLSEPTRCGENVDGPRRDGDAAWLQGAAWLDALVSQARRALVR